MKCLTLALGISSAVACGVFLVIYLSSADFGAAVVPAMAPLAGFYHIAEILERRAAKRSLAPGRTTSILTFEGYCIPWYLMAIYGTLVVVGFVEVASLFAGMVAGVTFLPNEPTQQQLFAIMISFTFLAHVIAGYAAGRWIGERVRSFAIATVLLCAAAASVIIVGVDLLFAPADFEAMYGFAMTPGDVAKLMAGKTVLIGVPGLIGYWRGRRRRLGKYMSYLISILPHETRDLLVHLAYDEAQRVGARDEVATQPAPAPVAPSVGEARFA